MHVPANCNCAMRAMVETHILAEHTLRDLGAAATMAGQVSREAEERAGGSGILLTGWCWVLGENVSCFVHSSHANVPNISVEIQSRGILAG